MTKKEKVLSKALSLIVDNYSCPGTVESVNMGYEYRVDWKACVGCGIFAAARERKCWALALAGRKQVVDVNKEYKKLMKS